jgi:hypothetical protein
MVELQSVVNIVLSMIAAHNTCHRTDLLEPAVVTYQTSLQSELFMRKCTNAAEPDEGVHLVLPLLEFLAIDKPAAGGRLSLLAGIIMIRRWVRRQQPKMVLLP